MCRMLGIVANEPTDFRICLREAPRSLGSLSREHPHGWGVAVFAHGGEWTLQKEPACAHGNPRFGKVAHGSRGHVLVAHVRKRTVGPISIENTHPFEQHRWVFAHNGTIDDQDYLRGRVSPRRAAAVAGQTDSELFFAFLLTRLDAAGLDASSAGSATSQVLATTVDDITGRPAFGACNFLLSNGEDLYAYRDGRTLFTLERAPRDAVLERRESLETGAIVDTPWTKRRHAILVASERLTDEPWQPVAERTLLRVSRQPIPTLRVLRTPRLDPSAEPIAGALVS